MLFTLVSREDRFKAKPVIDIVAYRGGDVIMGWFFTLLSTGLGLGLAAFAAVGASIAGLWAIVGYQLGRTFGRREGNSSEAATDGHQVNKMGSFVDSRNPNLGD
jgi:AAA family ATP:ADP antiporter